MQPLSNGVKLLLTGLTIAVAAAAFPFYGSALVAAVVATIGCVLMWLDK